MDESISPPSSCITINITPRPSYHDRVEYIFLDRKKLERKNNVPIGRKNIQTQNIYQYTYIHLITKKKKKTSENLNLQPIIYETLTCSIGSTT